MMSMLQKFDSWFDFDGPAALVIREPLIAVEGQDGVIFPATFASSKDGPFKGGYNIDEFPDGTNICLIDSVGSQANRIEPIFMEEKLKGLVPQIVVEAGEKKVSILEAGHRAGDALVRCSALQENLQNAFKAQLLGDALPLAKIAPTSFVFGVWDSRDTMAKVPRLIASTVRAYNVRMLHRSAQYIPSTEYVAEGLLSDPKDNKKTKEAYSERGFIHAPASWSHGGVIADGGIRRDATLHLAALRLLQTKDENQTLALRRYILGLALVAFTYSPLGYLRQGCNIVLNPEAIVERSIVYPSGKREVFKLSFEEALDYAKEAATNFGVGEDRSVPFDANLAKKDVEKEKKTKGK